MSSLPNESLAKVFSFLTKSELLTASQVCCKWNEISKNPSLWKELDIEFKSKNLELFINCCNFLSEVPYIQTLKVRSNGNINIVKNSKEHKAFNNMTMKALNLKCLSVGESFKIPSPYLPSTITHLTFSTLDEPEIIDFIEHCAALESLNLSSYPKFINMKIIRPLLRHVESLKYLYIPCEDAECLNAIGDLSNLEVLVLLTCHDLNTGNIMKFSKLKNLQHLYIQNATNFNSNFISSLTQHGFSQLKHFAIDSCDVVTKECFDLISKQMCKLESFSISETTSTVNEIKSFLESCKTLQYISINIICEDAAMVTDLLQEILKIHLKRPFKSICICSLKHIRESIETEPNCKLQELFNNFTCLCRKWCLEDIASYDCCCFPNSRVACYHKQDK